MSTQTTTSTTPRAPIRPRRLEFAIDERVPRHFTGDAVDTHFWNALSVLFPEGETFFVDSVRHFREQITDDALRRDVVGFAGQEATHSREHEAYNAWLSGHGYSAEAMDRTVGRLLAEVRKLPPEFPLAATCSLEHMTALLAELVLTDEDLRARMDPAMFKLWAWHATEEIEHKNVAFDVYQQVSGSYAIRVLAHLVATILLGAFHSANLYSMLRTDGLHRKPSTWMNAARTLYAKKGYVTRLAPAWAEFLRRDFHPSQHDDRALLEAWTTRLAAM